VAEKEPKPAVGGDPELVLVVPRGQVPGGLDWRGVRAVDLEPYLDCALQVGTFRPRDEVEDDPSWQQIIPYLALFDGPNYAHVATVLPDGSPDPSQ
jgi:predicted NUDIX family phosphoesterase